MKKIAFFFIGLATSLLSEEINLSFIALDKGNWNIVVCENKQCHTIKTDQEPRTYDYNFDDGTIVYIASDKSVRLILEGKEREILESSTDAYTEPSFINYGKNIMLVTLINGNSTNTKITSIDLKGKTHKTLIYQHSTALEPYSQDGQSIYYANVSCVEGCGKIIQEIWHKDSASGEAQQLTLLNTLSHQPAVDTKQEFVYFSSAKKGSYHIWKYALKDGSTKQLTHGNATDGFPIPFKEGIVFLRRTNNQVELMKLDKKGNLTKLSLSQSYDKIRNLKVKQ